MLRPVLKAIELLGKEVVPRMSEETARMEAALS